MIKAAFHSTAELYDFVLKELTKADGIKDSNSLLVLRNFKHNSLEGVADVARGGDPPPEARKDSLQ